MPCDPNQLLEDSKCFSCKYDSLWNLYSAVEILLLCAIRDGEDLPCDPDYLAKQAACLLGCIPPGAMDAVKLRILCDIADGAGGGGGSNAVESEPADAFLAAIGYDGFENASNIQGVTSVTFNMAVMTGYVDLEVAPDLVSVSFPNLTTFGAGEISYIFIDNSPNFASFSAPLLQTFNTGPISAKSLTIQFCASFASLSLPSLVTLNNGIQVRQNAALVSVSIPLWVPTPGKDSLFDNNALDAASVNHILARHVASPTWGNTGESLALSGGTSAAPSGQGILDKATLLGRGAAVNTN